MKMMKKALSAVTLSAVLAVTAVVPSIAPITRVEAASPVKVYDFNGDTGMSSSGISGSTAPTITNDAERGQVLQFADGASSKLVQKADDPSLGDYDYRVDYGAPSSLSFPNPFSGKSLSGITIAYWLKIPSKDAASKGSGIVGFIGDTKTVVHPDKEADTSGSKDSLEDAHGPFHYGISCAYADPLADSEIPLVYFCGLHHNTYNFNETGQKILNYVNKWVFVTITQTNSSATVYFDGQKIEGDEYKNKRWNDGEVNGGTAGNTGQLKFCDFISMADVKAYVGFTGFSPTVSGVCIDDLMFFDSALSAADVSALYSSAKSGNVPEGPDSGPSSPSSNDNAAAEEAARRAREEAARKEAEAQAANKALTDALISSVSVTGMKDAKPSVAGIFRGDAAYTSLVAQLNGVLLRSGCRVSDVVGLNISFGGTQPEGVATISMNVPSGFNPSMMEVVRINDDGTVSKLNYTVENNVIKAKTNHFSTFAIVSLEVGSGSSSNLPNTGAASAGAVAAVGAVAILGGALLLRKKKEVEA